MIRKTIIVALGGNALIGEGAPGNGPQACLQPASLAVNPNRPKESR